LTFSKHSLPEISIVTNSNEKIQETRQVITQLKPYTFLEKTEQTYSPINSLHPSHVMKHQQKLYQRRDQNLAPNSVEKSAIYISIACDPLKQRSLQTPSLCNKVNTTDLKDPDIN
jgi:hypothetical protein